MAAPTPTEYLRQVGHGFILTWDAHWTDTGEFTNSAIIDVSADFGEGYTTKCFVKSVYIVATTGIEVELQFDATADEPLATLPEGATGPVDLDFRCAPDGHLAGFGAGTTGDVFLTTTGAADGDRVFIRIEGEVF
tara:strand:+ start:891 stop:1295 length:405 start_codon:yes stop_codon:yes gene_type:complete